jgi:hypothetical protein
LLALVGSISRSRVEEVSHGCRSVVHIGGARKALIAPTICTP